MKKLKVFLYISVLCLLPANLFALPSMCSWESGGCVVTVDQYDQSWEMSIQCNGGKKQYWSGQGTWGGNCKTGWD